MAKRGLFFFGILLSAILLNSQDNIRIDCSVFPGTVGIGEEGVLKIRVTPRPGIRISAHPEFMIRIEDGENFSFAKLFFMGSEFKFTRIQDGDGVFLNLDKEIEIPFTVSENAYIGKHSIQGEITYAVLSNDNWIIKTKERFTVSFSTRKSSPGLKKLFSKK